MAALFADAVRATFNTVTTAIGVPALPDTAVDSLAALAEEEGRMWLSAFATMPEFAGCPLLEES